jgi:hypothetical protein
LYCVSQKNGENKLIDNIEYEYHIEKKILHLHFGYKELMDFVSELDDLLQHELNTVSDNNRGPMLQPHMVTSPTDVCV